MNHQEYIDARSERDPVFSQELAIASAELNLATAIAKQRVVSDLGPGDLAKKTGISEERLEAIEDGDEITIAEALRLAHALDMTIAIEPDFRLSIAPAARVAF